MNKLKNCKVKYEFIVNSLKKYEVDHNLISNYDEPHRYYHNIEHIISMLEQAQKENILTEKLVCAIILHDVVYSTTSKTNEEDSAQYVDNEEIKLAILDTKTHYPTSKLGEVLCRLDLQPLNSTMYDFMLFEHKIFKEFQFVDYSIYKKSRIKKLKQLNIKQDFIDYVENRKINIGLYCGSFNPFHIGHRDILHKAEEIFDKVIIARGQNPNKNDEFVPLPEFLKYYQTSSYNGLLTDFIDSLGYDVTLIRGLRNIKDFENENTQYRFLKDLNPNIKVVNIMSDVENNHISSSAIRMLKKYNKESLYLC